MKLSSSTLEVQNSLSAALMGLFLLSPFQTSTFASAPGYAVFLDSGIPEEGWGLLFLALGVLQLAAVWRDNVVARRIASAMLAVLFGIYVAGVAVANPVSAAIPFVLPMVAGQAWAFYRARVVA